LGAFARNVLGIKGVFVLDMQFVRENPAKVKSNLKRRSQPGLLGLMDALLNADHKLIKVNYQSQQLKKRRNSLTREIQSLTIKKKPAAEKRKNAKVTSSKITALDARSAKLRETRAQILLRIPNLLDCSVPRGGDKHNSKPLRRWGNPAPPRSPQPPHGKFLQDAGLVDFERAAKISGSGFCFLKGDLALLDNALIQYSVANLTKKGFVPILPPLLMNRRPYEGVTSLDDFETVMYKIEGQDTYLIATSEHPLCAMHAGEIFEKHELPLKYAGISPCFRREVGAHGIDTKGIFRVHQFNKVEQFVFCLPEESEKWHERLIKNAEELMQGLRLPYRIVNVCAGDMGGVAAKKYDLEVWFPRESGYKELISCSNCTSYQAVRSNIKFRRDKSSKEFVHTLNSTAIATTRTIRAIVENFQSPEGVIKVPAPLVRYMGGIEEIKPKPVKK